MAVVVFSQVHQARGGSVQADLLLHATAGHIVGFSQRAVFIDPDLGYDEQADSLDPGRRPFHTGQNSVYDVFGEVLLRSGDEDFGSGDEVMVTVLSGGCLGVPHCTACIGLGELHGAGPLSGKHLLHELLFHLIRAKRVDQSGRSVGQARIDHERGTGPAEHLARRGDHHRGKPLPPVLHRVGRSIPAVFAELPVGLVIGFWHGDLSVLETATFAIPFLVHRSKYGFSKLRRFIQDHVQILQREILERFPFEQGVFHVEHFMQNKFRIAGVGSILCGTHRIFPPFEWLIQKKIVFCKFFCSMHAGSHPHNRFRSGKPARFRCTCPRHNPRSRTTHAQAFHGIESKKRGKVSQNTVDHYRPSLTSTFTSVTIS